MSYKYDFSTWLCYKLKRKKQYSCLESQKSKERMNNDE